MLHAVPFRQKVQINKSTADMANKKVTEESVSTFGRAGVCQKGEKRSGEASVVRHWSKALVILPQYFPHPILPNEYFSRLAQHWQNSSNFTQSIGCFILFVPCVPHSLKSIVLLPFILSFIFLSILQLSDLRLQQILKIFKQKCWQFI